MTQAAATGKRKTASEGSTVYLHIGLAKTGTTAIQRFFFENSEELTKHGVFYPDNFRSPETGYSDWGHHILSHKWGGWLDKKVFPITPDEAWEKTAAFIRRNPGRHVISSERFQDTLGVPGDKEIIRFVEDIIAPAKLVIVVYLRRQDMFAESHYKELVKNNYHTCTFAEYISNLPHFLDYAAYLDKIAQLSPSVRIVARIYDPSLFTGGNLFADFFDALDMQMPKINLTSGKRITNPSINSALVALMENMQTKPLWREKKFRGQLYRFFENHPELIDIGAPLLSDEDRKEILIRYENSNARVADLYLSEQQAHGLKMTNETRMKKFNKDRLIYSSNDVTRLLEIAINTLHRPAP